MKISAKTLSIIKNFAGINTSIAVKPGSVLKTLSPQNNIMANAQVDEEFPRAFAIYDLSQFLGAVSLFDDPDFEFEDQFVTVRSGKNSVRYYYADESMIKAPGDKKIQLPAVDVEVSVTATQLQEILKAASVLQVPEVAIEGDGEGAVRLVAVDTKNNASNKYSVDLDAAATLDKAFRVIFKAENLKVVNSDYTVQVCAKGISRFHSEKAGVEYFIAIESASTFAK